MIFELHLLRGRRNSRKLCWFLRLVRRLLPRRLLILVFVVLQLRQVRRLCLRRRWCLRLRNRRGGSRSLQSERGRRGECGCGGRRGLLREEVLKRRRIKGRRNGGVAGIGDLEASSSARKILLLFCLSMQIEIEIEIDVI